MPTDTLYQAGSWVRQGHSHVLKFVQHSGLAFGPHERFLKADLDARQALYAQIAERVWDPNLLLQEVEH